MTKGKPAAILEPLGDLHKVKTGPLGNSRCMRAAPKRVGYFPGVEPRSRVACMSPNYRATKRVPIGYLR